MKFNRVYRGTDDTQAGGAGDQPIEGGFGGPTAEGVSEHPAVSFLAELEAKLETVGEELKAEALALIAKVREVL
jgi:hypothetical protein